MPEKSLSDSDNNNTNVVVLDVETSLDLPLERVLDGARPSPRLHR